MKLHAKKIKRHMVRTYTFYQLNLRALIIADDQKKILKEFEKDLPETDKGYLAFAYIDDELRIAFIGTADDESDEFEFFNDKEILSIAADAVPTLLVRPVKLNQELSENAFIQQVIRQQANEVLPMSTLSIRALDSFRDPLIPSRVRAFHINELTKIEELIDLHQRREKACVEVEELAAAAVRKAKKAKKDKTGDDEGDGDLEAVDEIEIPEAERNISEELAQAVSMLWIRDLSPANNDSWRAKLETALPDSQLKAGDDVAVKLRRVCQGDLEIALLFVDPQSEPQDTAIKLTSYRASRLPWRKAYELECTVNNDFHEVYYLGREGDDCRLFNKITDDIRKGSVDPELYLDMVQKDDIALDFSRELYRCHHCGDLHVTRRLRIITPEGSKSEAYYCPRCGERSKQVSRVHIASLNCPNCREPLDMKPEKIWRISEEDEDSIILEQ